MKQESIEEALRYLPFEWAVVFVARLAAQCLPALLEKQNQTDSYFAYWPKEQRKEYLCGVMLESTIFIYDSFSKEEAVAAPSITVSEIFRPVRLDLFSLASRVICD